MGQAHWPPLLMYFFFFITENKNAFLLIFFYNDLKGGEINGKADSGDIN
jgi:hypothetical protein